MTVGIALCGGLGTRLKPFTDRVSNKHLIPVYDKPMIMYPIKTLVDAGITDICVVTGGKFVGDILNFLGDGKEFGANIVYAFQYGERGIADALSKAHPFAKDENICVVLGDNIYEGFDLATSVREFDKAGSKAGAKIFLKEVHDPERYGVAVLNEKQEIAKIVEKPKTPESNLAVTGLYMYDQTIWDKIKNCKPSGRGELEITDVNNLYLKEQTLKWELIKGFWSDSGVPDSLVECSTWAKEQAKGANK